MLLLLNISFNIIYLLVYKILNTDITKINWNREQQKNMFFVVLIQLDLLGIEANYLQCNDIFLKLEEFLAALFHSANTNKCRSKSMVWYPILISLLKTPSIFTFFEPFELIIGTSVHKRNKNFSRMLKMCPKTPIIRHFCHFWHF